MGRGLKPYPYQRCLAVEGELPARLAVPTGLGKTAAVALAWLWRRLYAEPTVSESTPRRLVYCLPMRVLVEQTAECCRDWFRNLDLLAENAPHEHPRNRVAVHLLMGGDLEIDWDRWPERDQILIGTQDMLLSRALNRGYAMSRFRWPVQFGLLNNDCLWVMDEVQLMGSGLATTTQLHAFRRELGTIGPARSIWMSATMRPEWLDTVDIDLPVDASYEIVLSDQDKAIPTVKERFEAKKGLSKAAFLRSTDGIVEAKLILEEHRAGTRTLVVVNTVKRAQMVYKALKKKKPEGQLLLLHSRFRPSDRKRALSALMEDPDHRGTIAVSTQVIEAGVDVSSRTLITDLAPWSSLVQRFGRCNRAGEDPEAQVIWIEPPDLDDDKKLKATPYTGEELREAHLRLSELTDVGPQSLPPFEGQLNRDNVVRRKDLIDLFDTTPDLAGADIDVSRFVRDSDDHDTQVFWRQLLETEPSVSDSRPRREELCRVPIADSKRIKTCWRWDHLERQWVKPDAIYPGLVLMLPANEGGYSEELGWTGDRKQKPTVIDVRSEPSEANDDDTLSSIKTWQALSQHTSSVVDELEGLVSAVDPTLEPWRVSLRIAARWHDVGKAHLVFQRAMLGDPPANSEDTVWAKTVHENVRYSRPGFRHELASALAMLLSGKPDLAVYLAAAHHGKVRLSIRSLPHESPPADPMVRFARGVWEGDVLPACDLGGGVSLPETVLSLSYMELGDGPLGASWLKRMLALRDNPLLGPFRLAFLEALFRVCDWRASATTEVDHD